MKKQFISADLTSRIVEFRRMLHASPELSLQEEQTAQKIASKLDELNIPYRMNVGGHGIVAELNRDGNSKGPTIALRADTDALPIEEETDLPFASLKKGIMHACGHDAHTAILLGAIELLRNEKLAGNVRFIFQAAEELNLGAKAMIEAGVLDGVDEIYGLHNLPTLSAGKLATCVGPMMGSVDRIDIHIEGKGAHGAIPNEGIDPIVCASAMVMAFQSIISRELSPFDPAVITIGSINAGNANNVIPQYATLSGTVRTYNPNVQVTMKERIERIMNNIAESYRCKAQLIYTVQVPVLVNHDQPTELVNKAIDATVGAEHRLQAKPTLAGEDFSLYVENIPGSFFWLGSGPLEQAEEAYGLHHPKFTLNESCLPIGAVVLAEIVKQRLAHGKES
jgi:amidohydrolase